MAPAVPTNPKSKPMMQLLSVTLDLNSSKMLPEQLFEYVTDLDELIPEAPSYEELFALIDERPAPTNAPVKETEQEVSLNLGDAEPEKEKERPVSKREDVEPEPTKVVVDETPTNNTGFATEEEVTQSDDFELGDFDIDA
jgi:hypothetical protein